MRKKAKVYSDEDRLSLLQLYYESGLSKNAFCKQHGVYDISLLNSWIRRYSVREKTLNLPSDQEFSEMPNRSKDDYKDENAQLKKRIKDLEKALSYSKLETEARDLMITRAEEYFNIPIRKKSGAK
ncbi:transposase [Bacteroides sp. 224]|uniref:transposase n=1 Tax=Bacteroides sp. 224 TaxID=2302936 RepID=UPI0013D3EA20|nr:transposase [Bacteroides sp. 224]NDV66644.1 transposase [Bacteroides sp. 224]